MRVVSMIGLALVLTACPGRAKTPPVKDGAVDQWSSDLLYTDYASRPDGHGHPEASAPDSAVVDAAVPDSAVVAFGDVTPGHPQYQQIQWVAQAGFMLGCQTTPPMFCPDDPLTRAQAAVTLVRMKHGNSFTYSSTPHFPNDVAAGHWAFKYIQRLADDKITAGCGAGTYCPEASMLRRHWAVFLFNVKTL